jgi:carbon storage regulator CsrA
MLILERRNGEAIAIFTPLGQEIRLVILNSENNRVKVGIEAPAEAAILRDELITPDARD